MTTDFSREYRMPKEWSPGKEIPKEIRAEVFDEENVRWKVRPKIEPCWKGVDPVWNEKAVNYQSQLFCVYWGTFINPDGFTCEICREGMFPSKEALRTRIGKIAQRHKDGKMPERSMEHIENIILSALSEGHITEAEALEIVGEFKLG